MYRTNKYGLPLLNIVAVSGMNSVIPVAQCWLPGENEANITWALQAPREMQIHNAVPAPRTLVMDRAVACMNAVDAVFRGVPSLVCRWRMNRNVLAKTRQVLGQIRVDDPQLFGPKWKNSAKTDEFMSKFLSTIVEFEANRAALAILSPPLSAYLDRNWWKYNEKIVRCWTKHCQHLVYKIPLFSKEHML